MSPYAAVVLCKITHQKLHDPEPQPHSLKITVFYVLLTLQSIIIIVFNITRSYITLFRNNDYVCVMVTP